MEAKVRLTDDNPWNVKGRSRRSADSVDMVGLSAPASGRGSSKAIALFSLFGSGLSVCRVAEGVSLKPWSRAGSFGSPAGEKASFNALGSAPTWYVSAILPFFSCRGS